VITIGTNTTTPLALLGFLSRLVFRVGRRAHASAIFRVLFLVGLVYCAIELLSLSLIGNLVLKGPVPISPGTCGMPIQNNLSVVSSSGDTNLGIWEQHATNLLDRAAAQFSECTDHNNAISCPGPAGSTFSWDVVESEPDYCWFGPVHCFNGSRTISQRATLVPSDLGTIRQSSVSLTIEFECSHVDNSGFYIVNRMGSIDEQQFLRL